MAIPAPVALHHTCFVVRDIESAARALSGALGIGPWNVWTLVPAESRVHGKVTPFSFKAAMTTVGGGTYGLLIPRTRRIAAAALIVFMIAVLPANIHAAQAGVTLRGAPATPIVPRVALQALFIALLWWSGVRASASPREM